MNYDKSDFKTGIKIFSILIGVALIIKIVIQGIQKLNTNDRALTVATKDHPLGDPSLGAGGQADITIGMYGWTVFWTMCLMVTTLAILMRRYPLENFTCTSSKLFHTIPFALLIGLLVSTMLLNYNHRTKINMNLVPSSYFGWSIASTASIFFMFLIIWAYVNKLIDCTTPDVSPIAVLLTCVAIVGGVCTAAIIIITYVLVSCYTTDG